MKTLTAAVVALLLIPAVGHAQGHVPPPCEAWIEPGSTMFQCASPYVPLQPGPSSRRGDTAWHCCDTGQTVTALSEGGCLGGDGLRGWSPPAAACQPKTDTRSVITTSVRADLPVECSAAAQTVEMLATEVEDKLLEADIILRRGHGQIVDFDHARALLAVLAEHVTASGQLASAYSDLLGCVVN